MRWAGFAGRAGLAGRGDDGGEVSAVVGPSRGEAALGNGSQGTARLQLTVWEQWV
jgi:hypothetical protein